MNVRDLQYLVALADHRHFGRAAEVCFVSQPTLSTQIRKLEEELGIALIERAPRNVMLTPAGIDIVARARRVLNEIEQIKQAASRRAQSGKSAIRLGVFPTLGPYLLPHVLPAINARFPMLELLLVEEKSDLLLDQLENGKLDAALLAMPIHNSQLHEEELFEEPFLLAVPQSHPLSRHSVINAAELSRYDLMLLEDGHCLREQALEICRMSGGMEAARFRATSLETLRQMVLAGSGMTLLPQLAARSPFPHADKIHLLPFNDPPPGRHVGMYWRKSSALSETLADVADIIQNTTRLLLES